MSDSSDSALVSALRRQMTVSVARQVAATGNLSNLDTPGYKAKEVSFDDALGAELGTRVTNTRHIATTPANGISVQEQAGLLSRRDGNNVQLDRELLAMSRASGDFAAAQTALAAKFRLVRYAISEGR